MEERARHAEDERQERKKEEAKEAKKKAAMAAAGGKSSSMMSLAKKAIPARHVVLTPNYMYNKNTRRSTLTQFFINNQG